MMPWLRRRFIAPDDVDQPRGARAGSADRVDGRVILGEEIIADDDPMAGAGGLGDAHRFAGKFLGAGSD